MSIGRGARSAGGWRRRRAGLDEPAIRDAAQTRRAGESWPGNRRGGGDLKPAPGCGDRGRSAPRSCPGPALSRGRTRRLRRSALVAVATVAATPGTAYAHTGGRIATDYEARIAGSGLRPAVRGVRAQTLGGDLKLQLTDTGPHVVVVLGLLGEPFLRFSTGRASTPTRPRRPRGRAASSRQATRCARRTAPPGGRCRAGTPSPGTRTVCGRSRSCPEAGRRRRASRRGRCRCSWMDGALRSPDGSGTPPPRRSCRGSPRPPCCSPPPPRRLLGAGRRPRTRRRPAAGLGGGVARGLDRHPAVRHRRHRS